MYTITNMTKSPLIIDGVSIEPGEQIGNISVISPAMAAMQAVKKLRILSDTEEDRKKDVDAINEGVEKMGKIIGEDKP